MFSNIIGDMAFFGVIIHVSTGPEQKLRAMKKLYLFIAGFALCLPMLQAQQPCGTMQHLDHLKQTNPYIEKSRAKSEQRVSNWIRENGDKHRSGGIITIPVVVHVVYGNATENISDARIFSQFDVLNEDFRKMNADTSNIPAVWDTVMADCDIEFCLAQRTPTGDPTNGIIRTSTIVSNFSFNDEVKSPATGGVSGWPPEDYLNIWVCDLIPGLLGYAQFPGGPDSTDGVVVDYEHFGKPGTVAQYDQGRTSTHEVGHWLGLRHIWGDDGGACSGSDLVADTPNQEGPSNACFTFPSTDACSPTAPGIMFMNYMNYAPDACMNSFTEGQKARMHGVLNTDRLSLQSSQGCVPVVLQQTDAAVQSILSPNLPTCTDSITPAFVLYNRGTDVLTSVDINWQLDGGAVNTQPWTGSLASLATQNVTLPTMAISTGAHTLTIFTTNPNGTGDQNLLNDTLTQNFTILPQVAGQSVPYVQDFESGSFPPAGWSINNPDNDITWALRSNAGANGSSRSSWIDMYNYAAPGQRDEMLLPAVDFSGQPGPALTFDLSHKLYSQTGFSDTLYVLVSTDCGATWNQEYKKFDQALCTASPYFTTSAFVPSGDAEWRNEFVNLSAYAGYANVQVKFIIHNDYENNLFLDNINLLGFVGLENGLNSNALSIYPNPGEDHFKLAIQLRSAEDVEISVMNPMGMLVQQLSKEGYGGGEMDLNLSNEASGVYFIRLRTSTGTITKKLVKY